MDCENIKVEAHLHYYSGRIPNKILLQRDELSSLLTAQQDACSRRLQILPHFLQNDDGSRLLLDAFVH